jgi:hypothetical protein
MKDVRTIFVPVVKNKSFEPGLSVMTANAINRRINNDGTFSLASNEKGSDAVLEVTITDVRRSPLRSSRSDLVLTEQYEIIILAEATLTNLKQGRRVFTNKKVQGSSSYFVQSNPQESERQTLPLAAEDLAQRVVSLASEGW